MNTPSTPMHGLTEQEIAQRRAEFGPNELHRDAKTSMWALLAAQFKSPVIGLLAGACVVSAALGEVVDAVAIGAIVVINALVGFFQEYRAERAILALRSMTAPRARVIRGGRAEMIPAVAVVPGDVLVFESGDVVAADADLLEAHVLATNEASLTGESTPAEKHPGQLPDTTPLAERSDRLFMGTSVVRGTGTARVVATGMHTELGKIANLLASVHDTVTPLQRRLARVSRILLYACAAIVAVVAGVGLLRGAGALEVFVSAVSLAVAAVPEGLPAIVTIALAIGVQRMGARNVLVRRLPAVETLGCASVICTDKTGTLTAGVMAVRTLWGPDEQLLLATAAACCDAELAADGNSGVGDPTELALLVAAAQRSISRADIERDNPRIEVHPFDAERKRMSILRADGTLYLKGAVEIVVPRCIAGADGALAEAANMATRGLRVLAVATGTGAEEQDLRLLGLIGIADPPRPEAITAIARARDAGIRVVMITGDHPITAQAIARELGLLAHGEDPAEVVHARATPEDKLRIVRAWKARGAVVAMTGDGVNDAPALREADVGVAMGKTGTEVTREAADMVLADDNFASIIDAVHEGRGIFDNIRKTLVLSARGQRRRARADDDRGAARPPAAAPPAAPAMDQSGHRWPACARARHGPRRPRRAAPSAAATGRAAARTRGVDLDRVDRGAADRRRARRVSLGPRGARARRGAQPRLHGPRIRRVIPGVRGPPSHTPVLGGRRIDQHSPTGRGARLGRPADRHPSHSRRTVAVSRLDAVDGRLHHERAPRAHSRHHARARQAGTANCWRTT